MRWGWVMSVFLVGCALVMRIGVGIRFFCLWWLFQATFGGVFCGGGGSLKTYSARSNDGLLFNRVDGAGERLIRFANDAA